MRFSLFFFFFLLYGDRLTLFSEYLQSSKQRLSPKVFLASGSGLARIQVG